MRVFAILSLFITTFFFIDTQILHAKDSTESAKPKVDYTLAHPGMLPDHPLYVLKKLRDKIIEKTIGDPVNKIDFYRLQTDKGIAASEELAKKGQMDLSLETALKAEHNFTLITYEVKKYPWKLEKDHYERLKKAGAKHQEVLEKIRAKAPYELKDDFETVIYFSKTNFKELETVLKTSRRR